jgi:polar amino acid transport system substrate-binding protein
VITCFELIANNPECPELEKPRVACTLFLLLFASRLCHADPPPLRWGTDPTGGAPFIQQDAAGKYIGFEVEFADYFAKKLQRTSVMVAGDWANLPQQLNKPADIGDGIDIVFNGYELRKDLCEQYAPTRAYYAYRLALMMRKDNASVQSWDDLKGKEVGVLGGTAAHDYLLKNHADADIKSNPDVANVIKLVQDRRMDATVQDGPPAVHFCKEYPELTSVPAPGKPGYYVIYYRKTDVELGKQLDAAIADGLRDGTFKRILQKYDLWNADQEELIAMLDQPWPPSFDDEKADTTPWPRLFRDLLKAAGMTIFLAVTSFPIAMLIGLTVAVLRVYGPVWVKVPCVIYVEVLRGTPLLLQLFCIYYMIPELFGRMGMPGAVSWLTPIAAGILGLAINYSAYEAENYRAGLLAVPAGQMEAALSLGMSPFHSVTRIVVPQAVRIVIPPVTNDFIALFKDTSACSIIFVVELTRKYNELFNFNRSLIIELAVLTAAMYLMMSYPLSIVARRLERRLASAKGGRS